MPTRVTSPTSRLAPPAALFAVASLAAACAQVDRASPPAKPCMACHAKDLSRPTFPNHEVPGFSRRCQDCHGEKSWKPAKFKHDKYPLTGKHKTATCKSCHATPGKLPTTCYGCHARDRTRPTFPSHTVAGFPTACETCHTTAGWKPANFDHKKWPLTGKHKTTTCMSCHKLGTKLPTTCIGCHEKDRSKPTFPRHTVAGFPTTCETCHTTAGWKPASFDHKKWPLTGKHKTTACASCHAKTPVPTTCIGCHATERARATFPDHRVFPTACESCHTTSAWKPATFDHDRYFPTSRGPHSKYTCKDCHNDPTNPKAFSCIDCHKHRRDKMDKKHLGEVRGYVYASSACLRCHPKGKE